MVGQAGKGPVARVCQEIQSGRAPQLHFLEGLKYWAPVTTLAEVVTTPWSPCVYVSSNMQASIYEGHTTFARAVTLLLYNTPFNFAQ